MIFGSYVGVIQEGRQKEIREPKFPLTRTSNDHDEEGRRYRGGADIPRFDQKFSAPFDSSGLPAENMFIMFHTT